MSKKCHVGLLISMLKRVMINFVELTKKDIFLSFTLKIVINWFLWEKPAHRKTCSRKNPEICEILPFFYFEESFFFYQTWRSSPVDFRHCGPNKGTLKFGDIRSKKGIFSLFAWFPYLTNFSNNVLKSQKLLTEIEHLDLNY